MLAQDDSLGDDARVEIQIEIEDLRDNFMIIPYNIMSERQFSTQSQQYEQTGELELMRRSADGSTILERMRERISNGEEWNVREAWRPEALLRVTKDDSGADVAEVYEAGWYVVDDSSIITQDRDGKFIERGKSVPTVREQLEWRTPYVVMDAESAEKSTELIDKQIEEIQAWREKMPDLIEHMQDETSIRTEAYMFLRDIVVSSEKGHLPMNIPDEPSYFLFGDKVYDSPFVSHKIEDYNNVGSDADYSPADSEAIKDKAELTDSYSVQSLSKDSVSLTRPSDAGFVYIKGINFHKNS